MICTHTFRYGREMSIGSLVHLFHDKGGTPVYGKLIAFRPQGDGYPQWVEVDVEVEDGAAPASDHYAREMRAL